MRNFHLVMDIFIASCLSFPSSFLFFVFQNSRTCSPRKRCEEKCGKSAEGWKKVVEIIVDLRGWSTRAQSIWRIITVTGGQLQFCFSWKRFFDSSYQNAEWWSSTKCSPFSEAIASLFLSHSLSILYFFYLDIEWFPTICAWKMIEGESMRSWWYYVLWRVTFRWRMRTMSLFVRVTCQWCLAFNYFNNQIRREELVERYNVAG